MMLRCQDFFALALTAECWGREIDQNKLSGTVDRIIDTSNIDTFNIGFNKFSGTVPQVNRLWLGVTVLYMEGYDLMSGTLPRHLNQSGSQLYALSIGSRRISGTLPETLGAIMVAFGAITSALSGTVHSALQKHIFGLPVKLDFSSNQISGSLGQVCA